MRLLENPDENPCFGCGPQVPGGLRLAFHERLSPEGVREVVTEHVPSAERIGWPGLVHTGIHFTVLYEVSYWAALTLGGRVMTSHGPAEFEQHRLPRVGQPFRAVARLLEEDRVEARTETADGKPCGRLVTQWRPASRARVEKAGLQLPQYLLDEMAP